MGSTLRRSGPTGGSLRCLVRRLGGPAGLLSEEHPGTLALASASNLAWSDEPREVRGGGADQAGGARRAGVHPELAQPELGPARGPGPVRGPGLRSQTGRPGHRRGRLAPQGARAGWGNGAFLSTLTAPPVSNQLDPPCPTAGAWRSAGSCTPHLLAVLRAYHSQSHLHYSAPFAAACTLLLRLRIGRCGVIVRFEERESSPARCSCYGLGSARRLCAAAAGFGVATETAGWIIAQVIGIGILWGDLRAKE
jgi:hypothetical protein